MNLVTEKNATSLRKYFMEYVVLFLTVSVITLFYMYHNLNDRLIELQSSVIIENTKSNIELKQQIENFKLITK